VQSVAKWCTIGWLGYQATQSIKALAGSTTTVDLALQFLLNTPPGITVTVSTSFGLFGVVYGLGERRLRLRRTAQMAGRVKELELRIDPNRSGSGLTPDGTPSLRDRTG
jgi:hypothetical protein